MTRLATIFLQLHRFTHERRKERTAKPYCVSLAFVGNDIDIDTG